MICMEEKLQEAETEITELKNNKFSMQGVASADANKYYGKTKNGVYAINGSSNNLNFPANSGISGGTLLVLFGNSGWGYQQFKPYPTGATVKYERNYFSGTWGEWKIINLASI